MGSPRLTAKLASAVIGFVAPDYEGMSKGAQYYAFSSYVYAEFGMLVRRKSANSDAPLV
jgi:hypothetical protein